MCKCKAKVRNRKGFGPKFMHTCAFCVLFPESASGSSPSCVSHQGDFAYILSNRASESRLAKRQKMLIFANIEDVGRHPLFFVRSKGVFAQCFPVFLQAPAVFPKALAMFLEALPEIPLRLQALRQGILAFLRNFKKTAFCKHFRPKSDTLALQKD